MSARKLSKVIAKVVKKLTRPQFIIWYTPQFGAIRDDFQHKGWQSADEGTTGVFRTRAAANAAIRENLIALGYGGRPEARSRFSVRKLGGEK